VSVKIPCCVHQDGFHIDIHDFSARELREWSGKKLLCPNCGGKLVFRAGQQKAAHFAHVSPCKSAYYEPETVEHYKGKQLIKQWLQNLFPGNLTETECYVKEAQQRADVMTVFPDGHRLCLEIQCSSIPADLWRKRYYAYQKANVSQVWLVGGSMLNLSGKAIGKIRLNQFLRALLQQQNDQLFVIDVEAEKLVYLSDLLPLKKYKTIFSCRDVWQESLFRIRVSRCGTISTEEAERHFAQRKMREKQVQLMQQKRDAQLIEKMRAWTYPEVYLRHKERYRLYMSQHPVYHLVQTCCKVDLKAAPALFNQAMRAIRHLGWIIDYGRHICILLRSIVFIDEAQDMIVEGLPLNYLLKISSAEQQSCLVVHLKTAFSRISTVPC
jgi:competence CoiA-like predicted nuclease